MPETRIYDIDKARERMHTEVHTNVSMAGEGELIAVVRGILGNRTVDHRIRIQDNTLEEMYNYYYKGEMFEEGEWHSVEGTHRLSEDGRKVISGEMPSDVSESPIDEWVTNSPVHNMIEDITEIWEKIREEHITED